MKVVSDKLNCRARACIHEPSVECSGVLKHAQRIAGQRAPIVGEDIDEAVRVSGHGHPSIALRDTAALPIRPHYDHGHGAATATRGP